MDCCICLSKITDKQIQYKLSCNHVLHFTCYKKTIFATKGHIFIKCPLCREMNYNNEKPFTNPYLNIKLLCQDNLKHKRCKHILTNGHRCKRSSTILNYGYCNVHSKSHAVLPKDKYELMCDYLYYLLVTTNDWRTKINMIDMSKQMICKFPDKIHKLDDIHYYFNRFFQYNLISKDTMEYYINPNNLYAYYNLIPPPEEWVQECVTNKTLI